MHPVQTLGLIKSPDTGLPRFELHAEKGTPRVVVELRFDPNVFPDRTAELADGLRGYLRSKSPALRKRELNVQFVGPGELKGKRSKY